MIKNISIRGRVAFLISLFENLLLYYNYNKEEWKEIIEKLWLYTKIKYLDDWMYEVSEYMPNSVLEDSIDDAEFISESEFIRLNKLYKNTNQEVLLFLQKIFECGTCELYSRLRDNSPNTINYVEQAINIFQKKNIDIPDIKLFERYSYSECNGWGNPFRGIELSKIL